MSGVQLVVAWTLGLVLSALLWEPLVLLLRLYARRRLATGEVCALACGNAEGFICAGLCCFNCARKARTVSSWTVACSGYTLICFRRPSDASPAVLVEMSPSLAQGHGPLPGAVESKHAPGEKVSAEEASMMQLQAAYDQAMGSAAVPVPRVNSLDPPPQAHHLSVVAAAPADDDNFNPLLSSVFQGMSRMVDRFTSAISGDAAPAER